MAQWFATLVVLVCLGGSSLSRSWVGFDDNADFESWQADPDDFGAYKKSRYYNGKDTWESDENFDSGYENGYEPDKSISSNNGYYKDHESHAYGYHDYHQVGDHHDHGYNDNGGHHGHHTQSVSPGQPNQYWGSIGHHSHSTSSDQPGSDWGSHVHHAQTGPHGHNTHQPGQSAGPSLRLPQNNVNRPQGSRNDADRIVFPDNQVSTTRSPATTRAATTTARTTAQTTARPTTRTTAQTTELYQDRRKECMYFTWQKKVGTT